MNPNHALVLVLASLLFAAWNGFCLWDLARAKEARVLPKYVWAVIILISLPTGGIIYLIFGHEWT